MVSKRVNKANSSFAEAAPSTAPRHRSTSQHHSSTNEPSRKTGRSSQVPWIPNSDETIHGKIEHPESNPDRRVSESQESHVRVEALPQLLGRLRGSGISLKLTINDEVIYLQGLRTVRTEAANSEEGGQHVINADDGEIEHALTVCPRCDGWSEWVVIGGVDSPVDNVYSACSLCHGEGTIPNEELLRSMRYSRRRRRRQQQQHRRRSVALAQPQSATPHSQSLTNPPKHRDNGAEPTANRASTTNRKSPIGAACGQQRAHSIRTSHPQHATPSRQQVLAASASAIDLSNRSPKGARPRAQVLHRRPAATEACIRTNLHDASPGLFEQFPDEAELSNAIEDGIRLATTPDSPYHTERYRRAVRDFRRQRFDDDCMHLSMSPPPLRRPAPWPYVFW